jgi:23S rRNA pseudouridine2604 synthase
VRINVYISSTGFCSRRVADRIISEGRVTVNGTKASLGDEVGDGDFVAVDGKVVVHDRPAVYIAFHKPAGIESTTDAKKRDNIIAFLGHPERIFPVGRLDKDTTGLILLTNDGQIVNRILRAENAHEKEYVVQVDVPIDKAFITAMEKGVEIYNPVRHEKTVTLPCRIIPIDATAFRIILNQGLNLQIRRMCEALGRHVVRLRRIRVMNIELGNLPVGSWRDLTPAELSGLMKMLE